MALHFTHSSEGIFGMESRIFDTQTYLEALSSTVENSKWMIEGAKGRGKSENLPSRRPMKSDDKGSVHNMQEDCHTWNARTLNGIGKIEQFTNEMKGLGFIF